jgi:hypothetical protein
MHFDDDEPWRIGTDVDLYSVALHEAGHALGLGHSDRPGSVMYPYYRQAGQLAPDDIEAVRSLYAERQASPPGDPPAPPPPEPDPDPAPPPTTPFPRPRPPPTQDSVPPSLTLISPAASSVMTAWPTITVRGTAADAGGVALVAWSSRIAPETPAHGTTAWEAREIPLLVGTNYLVFRAYDTSGNSSWRSIVVVRR